MSSISTFPCLIKYLLSEKGQKDALVKTGKTHARVQEKIIQMPVETGLFLADMDENGSASICLYAEGNKFDVLPFDTLPESDEDLAQRVFAAHAEYIMAIGRAKTESEEKIRQHIRDNDTYSWTIKGCCCLVKFANAKYGAKLEHWRHTEYVREEHINPKLIKEVEVFWAKQKEKEKQEKIELLLETMNKNETIMEYPREFVMDMGRASKHLLPDELIEQVKEYIKQRELETKRKTEEAKQKKREKRAPLAAWGLEHGSDRLKLMLKANDEKFDWYTIAKEEWIKAHLPERFSTKAPEEFQEGDNFEERARAKPTEQELRDLLHWKEICEDSKIYSNATLTWNTCTNINGASLDLTLLLPSGETVKVFKFYPETFS